MRLTAILSGLALSLAASAAMACPSAERCGDRFGPPPVSYEQPRKDPYEDAYRDGYDAGYADGRDGAYDDDQYGGGYQPSDAPGVWQDERGLYIRGHRGDACGCAPPPPCNCEAGLTLSSSFFDGAGGVGPIPDGGYYSSGGGYYYSTSAGGSAYAFSSASARASARVSVSYRGGYSYRPPGGHGGHKGGGKRH